MKRHYMYSVVSMVISLVLVLSAVSPAFASNLKTKTGTSPSGLALSTLEETIDAYVGDYIGKTVPGAAVAVVKDGEIIFSKGYGFADVEAQKKVDPSSTIFEWGSITKLFTWTAAMQLAEDEKIDLDEDIRTYLPESFLESFKFTQSITMRDLMNHTGGFGDYGYDLIYDSPEALGSLEEALLKADPDQYFEVGSASAYSNYGTALAGLVIETVSGQKYDTYLNEHFFNVLDMHGTSADRKFNVSDDMVLRKAKGYKPTGTSGYDQTIWSYVGLGPAGSINGTVEDLAQFAIALTPEDGEVSPLFDEESTLLELLTPTYMNTANGFFEFDGQYQSFGHGGNTAGFTGQFAIVPDQRFAVVTLTNVKGEINIACGIQELLMGKSTFEFNESEVTLPDPKKLEGKYISYRRFEGSFLEILSYMAPLTVKAKGENQITLNMSGLEADYIQTDAYVYKISSNKVPIFNIAFPELKFKVNGDEVEQIIVGHGFDMSPLPKSKSQPVQIMSLFIVGVSIVLALVGIGSLIVNGIKSKKELGHYSGIKNPVVHIHVCSLFLIIALLNNTIVSLFTFISKSFVSYDSIRPFIVSNYVVAIGTGFLLIYTAKKWTNKTVSNKYRRLVLSTVYSLCGLLLVTIHWNFFSLH